MLALLLSHSVLDVSSPLWLFPAIFLLLHSCSLIALCEKARDRFPAALAQLLCSFHIWCTETNSAAENVHIAGNMSGDCEMRAAKASVSSLITLCLLEHEAEHIEGDVLMPNELQRSHRRESCTVVMERAEHSVPGLFLRGTGRDGTAVTRCSVCPHSCRGAAPGSELSPTELQALLLSGMRTHLLRWRQAFWKQAVRFQWE